VAEVGLTTALVALEGEAVDDAAAVGDENASVEEAGVEDASVEEAGVEDASVEEAGVEDAGRDEDEATAVAALDAEDPTTPPPPVEDDCGGSSAAHENGVATLAADRRIPCAPPAGVLDSPPPLSSAMLPALLYRLTN